MNTILKFSVELEELVGRKWQMAPNRMFQQLTDKTKKKKKHRPFYEAVDAHARRRFIKSSKFPGGGTSAGRRSINMFAIHSFQFVFLAPVPLIWCLILCVETSWVILPAVTTLIFLCRRFVVFRVARRITLLPRTTFPHINKPFINS